MVIEPEPMASVQVPMCFVNGIKALNFGNFGLILKRRAGAEAGMAE